MTLLRSAIVFTLLSSLKILSRIFYRHDWAFVGETPPDPWEGMRLVVFLNHTSLFEPVFLGVPPASFIWRLAAHGVVPAADKTTDRPLVGMVFRFIAHQVIPITRQRDDTWAQVLSTIEPNSMVVIAPEGRMKRANGLDLHGNPMTVRGGVADILHVAEAGAHADRLQRRPASRAGAGTHPERLQDRAPARRSARDRRLHRGDDCRKAARSSSRRT